MIDLVVNFDPRKPNLAQNNGRELCNVHAWEAKTSKFLVHLDHFSKYFKYLF